MLLEDRQSIIDALPRYHLAGEALKLGKLSIDDFNANTDAQGRALATKQNPIAMRILTPLMGFYKALDEYFQMDRHKVEELVPDTEEKSYDSYSEKLLYTAVEPLYKARRFLKLAHSNIQHLPVEARKQINVFGQHLNNLLGFVDSEIVTKFRNDLTQRLSNL